MQEERNGSLLARLRHCFQSGAGPELFDELDALREQALQFGAQLERLEESGTQVPDELYMAGSQLLEVLDILWDQAHGEEDELQRGLELLEWSGQYLSTGVSWLEAELEELSQAHEGVDL